MRDHPIFAPSWSLPGDIAGEEIVDVATLTLSSGTPAPNTRTVIGLYYISTPAGSYWTTRARGKELCARVIQHGP